MNDLKFAFRQLMKNPRLKEGTGDDKQAHLITYE